MLLTRKGLSYTCRMAFPFSVSGSFVVRAAADTTGIQKLLMAETEALLWKRSDDVSIEGQTIFSRPSFMAWFTAPGTNWHPMVPFDEVRVTISGDSSEAIVRYEFSTRRILKIVACGTAGLAGFVEITSFGSEGVVNAMPKALGGAALLFAWLFGANYSVGALRGPRWLRRHLRTTAMMSGNDDEMQTAGHIA
jgi:hypothetical protein